MASLIKNQIIKRLSKFVKNLSSNQINLSTLKGEGELSSINLDEKALEEITELPTWLKIQKATCGRAFIKIPWTNLKTLPIQIQLDDVLIEIETCEKLRDLNNPSNGTDPLIGKYGFTNRVIDGISLTITNLTFAIKAKNFKASIFLPSLDIYSITPNGKRVDTLTLTRLRNTAKDRILLFKEISWPNARIEASSNDNDLPGTAIRFIANSCQIRIAMKKSLQDSTLITSRLMVHFDDLLSVVNDAQLNSALNAYKEIIQLMKQAADQGKHNVGEKLTRLDRQSQPSAYQPKPPTTGNNEPMKSSISELPSNDPFARYDVLETSLHFNIKRLDLHIVADANDRLVENGAVQMTLANISIDHYPYHEFGSSKKHWIKYSDMQSVNRNEWTTRLHEEWHEQFNLAKASVPNDEISMKFEKALRTNRLRLFESCSVISIDDLVFYPVSLNNDKQQKRRRPLLTSDKAYYQLPDSLGIINIQHTEYYYPLPYSFPVPNSDLYIQIMPLVLRVDFATSSWLDAFVSTLSTTIDNSGVLKSDGPSLDLEHVAVKVEAMLPRIVISSDIFQKAKSNEQQMEILELNITKLLVTNTRTELTSDRNKLEQHLELFKTNNFFQQTHWPFSNTTTTRISPLFEKHPYDTYLYNNPLSKKTGALPEPQSTSRALHTYYTMTTDSLKKSAKFDIWNFHAENIYLDFTPASSSESVRLAKQTMMDTFSVTGWAVLDEKEKNPWANVLCILQAPSLLKISQKQYTFLMHLTDELGLFLDTLERNKIQARSMTKKSPDDIKITICLAASTTFTLAVIDGLEDEVLRLPSPPPSSLPEADIEPVLRDTSESSVVIDLITTTTPIVASTVKVDPSTPTKNPKKSKFEENLQRGLDIISKSSRGSSLASSMMSDNSDETSSQLDITEDLDADLEASLFLNDSEQQQQQKVTRIELDDDSISLTGKNYIKITPAESINGVFVKLNQINVCITEDEETTGQPMYVACNVKYLRLDEFSSLKFDAIKPKLFENERFDEFNNDHVPPIIVRVDFLKGDSPPLVTLRIQDRSLTTTSHALDILSQNLEEIFTAEEKLARRNQSPKLPPIDIHLTNVQFTLELVHEHSTTEAVVEPKLPMKISIESMHVLRQIDGQVIIRDDEKPIKSDSNDSSPENFQQLELLRSENERLQSELNAQKTEITVLRGERDSLMHTISKLDIELTQAEYQRVAQQQVPRKK